MRSLLDIFNRKREVSPVNFAPNESDDLEVWQPREIDRSSANERIGEIPETGFESALESAELDLEQGSSDVQPVVGESVAVDEAVSGLEGAEVSPSNEMPAGYVAAESAAFGLDLGEPLSTDSVEAAFQRGKIEAMEQVNVELATLRSEFAQAVRDVQELSGQLSSRYCSEAVELAAVIAKAVVGEELRIAPETMVTIVKRALEEAPEAGELVIRCHPDDLAVMQEQVPQLTQQRGAPVSVRAAAGQKVERGGCTIQFKEGAIDAQPSVSVDVLKEAVEASLAGRRAIPKGE